MVDADLARRFFCILPVFFFDFEDEGAFAAGASSTSMS